MKLYIVSEIGYYYNDQTYDRYGDTGTPVKAFKDEANAKAEAKRLNEEKCREHADDPYDMIDNDGEKIKEFYAVNEIEAADEDVKTYKSAKQNAKKAFEAQRKAAQKAFKELAKELFAKHKKLKSFGWRQYTPHFNDGDVCRFSVHSDNPIINGAQEPDDGRRWNSDKEQMEQVKSPDLESTFVEPVKEFLREFDQRDLEYMFGDHATVTVHRNGKIEVEEYEDD